MWHDNSYSDIEDEKMNSKKWKSKKNTEKRRRDEDVDDVEAEEEEDDDDDGIIAETENVGKEGDGVQKTKRKKKQKKAKGPNNWIYVSGLPVDVTLEEIKDHFSKVYMNIVIPCLCYLRNLKSHAILLYYRSRIDKT